MFKIILISLYFTITLFAQNLVTFTNYEEALNSAKKNGKNILMFVYTDSCSWCKKMKKETLSNKNSIEFINKNFIFLTINREKDSFPKEFSPRFIPTTYLIDAKNEEEIYALYGFKSSKELISELDDLK